MRDTKGTILYTLDIGAKLEPTSIDYDEIRGRLLVGCYNDGSGLVRIYEGLP